MSRFFVNDCPENGLIELTGENAGHISLVLRAKIGDCITVCDNACTDYECEITGISKKSVTARILGKRQNENEPGAEITLYQALPKGDKMDTVIQKCVEIGVRRIVPVETENSVVKIKDNANKKLARYNKIAEAAAKQCGRGRIPVVSGFLSFEEAVLDSKGLDGVIIPYEKETASKITTFTNNFNGKTIGVFIGPEGGFSDNEIDFAVKNGLIKITLGKRILRTETAGLVTLVILLHELEE